MKNISAIFASKMSWKTSKQGQFSIKGLHNLFIYDMETDFIFYLSTWTSNCRF